MLFPLEGQPQNLLTFSGQIDVKHYVREKLAFLTGWCCVIFKLSDTEIKRRKVFRATYSIFITVSLLNITLCEEIQ